MSSSVSLPSNTSLQHSDLPKKTTSDNHLHLTERKISRELLTKATSDINFNPIIEVRLTITVSKFNHRCTRERHTLFTFKS